MECSLCDVTIDNRSEGERTPEEIDRQLQTLEQKREALEQGNVAPQQLASGSLCSDCKRMIAGVGQNPSKEDLDQALVERMAALNGLAGNQEYFRA